MKTGKQARSVDIEKIQNTIGKKEDVRRRIEAGEVLPPEKLTVKLIKEELDKLNVKYGNGNRAFFVELP